MENTNTDARKSAEKYAENKSSSEVFRNTHIRDFLAGYEFAQSHPATLDKGEVSYEEIEKEAAERANRHYMSWDERGAGYFVGFKEAVRRRESLSEQPEAKPTESEKVEKKYSLDDMKDSFRAGRALQRTEVKSFQNPVNFQTFIDRLNSLKQ